MLKVAKFSRESDSGTIVFLGRLPGIERLVRLRNSNNQQGPRDLAEEPYFLDVGYTRNKNRAIVKSVHLRLPENPNNAYCLFMDETHEGEVMPLKESPGIREYYLRRDGVAVWELAAVIFELEERHELQALIEFDARTFSTLDGPSDELVKTALSSTTFEGADLAAANRAVN